MEEQLIIEGGSYSSYWWKADDGLPISEDHVEGLHQHAEMRINEMRARGFCSGELNEAIYINPADSTELREYSGWWKFLEEPLLDERELATVLAALRLRQNIMAMEFIEPDSLIEDIATDGGSFEALNPYEVDNLCEKLNP